MEPDTTEWKCAPAACERVIGLVETAAEPRLRDVALVAGVASDGSIGPTVGLYMGGFHGVRDVPFFLLDENLPSGFVPDPGSGFEVIGEADWEARPSRAGGGAAWLLRTDEGWVVVMTSGYIT